MGIDSLNAEPYRVARPALDPLYKQQETDPRFVFVEQIDSNETRPFEIYELHPEITIGN